MDPPADEILVGEGQFALLHRSASEVPMAS
jgi:hypothetical protein